MIMVSACLVGVRCRYDGTACASPWLLGRLAGEALIPVCPEVAGGAPVPRSRSQMRGGPGGMVIDGRARVVREDGRDVTEEFLRGARAVLELSRSFGVEAAYLKSRSPSCGVGRVWCDGELSAGNGVAAEMLSRGGVEVIPVE